MSWQDTYDYEEPSEDEMDIENPDEDSEEEPEQYVEAEEDLGPEGPLGPDQHYLVGQKDPPTPKHAYSVTIGKPGLDIDGVLKIKCIEYLKSKCGAGVVAIEKNADGSEHFQCALVFKEPGKPSKFNRDMKKHLGWDFKAGTSKHVQCKGGTKWTDTYTFQNVAGGYCAKEDKNPTIWGIHPQFLLQGKVAYGNFKSNTLKGKEISQYNFVPVLFPLGKRKGCKTLRELLKTAMQEKYYFHKCGGRLSMDQLRQDYLRYIEKDGQDVDDLWQNMATYK